jgi:hypothetical protein
VGWGAATGVAEELSTAPHFTKMLKSSMFSTPFGLIELAVLAVLLLPFLA